MILGAKARWTALRDERLINLAKHFELHLELEDVNERFDEQVNFLRGFPDKVFHFHMPFRLPDRSHVDFSQHFDLMRQCVRLGDVVNQGSFRFVVHNPCLKGLDWSLIKSNVDELLSQSSKVVLCFENLHGQDDFRFRGADDFVELFKLFPSRVKMCLDVCHAYLFKPQRFDDFIDLVGDKIIHAHIADVGLNLEHGVQVGEGIIDWVHVFSKLPKDVVLIPEVTNSHLNNHAELFEAVKRIREYLN